MSSENEAAITLAIVEGIVRAAREIVADQNTLEEVAAAAADGTLLALRQSMPQGLVGKVICTPAFAEDLVVLREYASPGKLLVQGVISREISLLSLREYSATFVNLVDDTD